MIQKSNVELLQENGLLENPAPPEVEREVEKLSDEEVRALIAVKQKVGFQGQLFTGIAPCSF